jgi:hypothetical protein
MASAIQTASGLLASQKSRADTLKRSWSYMDFSELCERSEYSSLV